MALYIEAKVKYEKAGENGRVKKVSVPYLVDALSCTEAEARVTEEVRPYISGDFSVSAVKKTNIAEVFRSDGNDDNWWYNVKANFITIDEKTGVEKKTATNFLVEAYDFRNALENFIEGMKGTMADYEIASISETAIMDVLTAKE